MFGLLKRWRRRRVLARQSIPDALWNETVRALPALARLEPEVLGRLRSLALLFLQEKSIEPAGGMILDDVMRVRLAALACLPVLELGLDCYDGFVSVIVYPGEFMVEEG
jgi:MtfA peptidase